MGQIREEEDGGQCMVGGRVGGGGGGSAVRAGVGGDVGDEGGGRGDQVRSSHQQRDFQNPAVQTTPKRRPERGSNEEPTVITFLTLFSG